MRDTESFCNDRILLVNQMVTWRLTTGSGGPFISLFPLPGPFWFSTFIAVVLVISNDGEEIVTAVGGLKPGLILYRLPVLDIHPFLTALERETATEARNPG